MGDLVTPEIDQQQSNESKTSIGGRNSGRSNNNNHNHVKTSSSNSNVNRNSTSSDKNSVEEEACVVCFKAVGIYSIGECDHPVCYECSTRMRVLCQQNECPICRQVLSKVIFTYDKLPYKELEAKNRSECYHRKYQISFYNRAIQQKFYELLDHPCPICNVPPYRTFHGLRNHVRKEHDLHYCDLCIDHLKIFTFERRCYTHTELGLHRTKGDADNRSHRGHPLCEYCNKRYLDRDELFRHLRREHYFCHFCDADGCNEFYKDYEALADHFREDHFLCEEGRCATEQFIGAFRTEIDYKAHVANVHGKTLNKQQAKQTRTLQLEITLGPRGQRGQNDQQYFGVRSRRGPEQYHEPPEYATSQLTNQQQYTPQQNSQNQQQVIDAASEQEFPALAGTSNGPNVSLVRPPPPSMRNRSGISGLARTKENFPELGSAGGGGQTKPNATNQTTGPPISSFMKNSSNPSKPSASVNKSGNGMVIHVSNRPTSSQPASSSANQNGSKKQSMLDFPALPSSSSSSKLKKGSKALDEDLLLPSPSNQIPLTNVSAKHRPLINEYVSVANPNNFHKIQMVQKEEAEAKAKAKAAAFELAKAPKLTAQDFPSLGPASSNNNNNYTNPAILSKNNSNKWTKPLSEKKQRDLENRKTKVAPAPQLPSHNNNKQSNPTFKNSENTSNSSSSLTKKDKKQKDKQKTNENSINSNTSSKNKEKLNLKSGGNNGSQNNNEFKTRNLNEENDENNPNTDSNNGSRRPPPGFNNQQSVKPPPGFQTNVTVNSVAKSPNSLTFTSSLGESYSIIPSHVYTPPSNSTSRNQVLVNYFKESLISTEALEEFRYISQRFRDGSLRTQAYYEHCEAALKHNFDKVFPELLVLLPDISKQQSLYLVHQQRLNTMPPSQRKSLPKFEVCSTCKQVLLPLDVKEHMESHFLEENFPSLDRSGANLNRK